MLSQDASIAALAGTISPCFGGQGPRAAVGRAARPGEAVHAAADRHPTWASSRSPPSLAGFAHRILHIASSLMRRAFGFVDLAFGLHLLVVGNLAGRILDRALRLVGGALDMFLVHRPVPSCWPFWPVSHHANGRAEATFRPAAMRSFRGCAGMAQPHRNAGGGMSFCP